MGRNIAVAIVFLLSASVPPAHADEVDLLAITHDFLSLPRTIIVVAPVPQPEKGKGKLEMADSLGRIMTEELIGAVQKAIPAARTVLPESAPSANEGLLVEARFSKLVPGSRGKRFWIGFGAGKSVTEVSGEIKDRSTGRVVARFTHARLSWCCGFGNNDHEIRSNLALAATDIAEILAGRFHVDQAYAWLEQEPAAKETPQPDTQGEAPPGW